MADLEHGAYHEDDRMSSRARFPYFTVLIIALVSIAAGWLIVDAQNGATAVANSCPKRVEALAENIWNRPGLTTFKDDLGNAVTLCRQQSYVEADRFLTALDQAVQNIRVWLRS